MLEKIFKHISTLFHRVSAHEFILLFVGVYLVIQYTWIMDDAFIYFRYVDNFLFRDLGFVFNEGEYVEGYTSPAWLLILTAIRSLGLDFLSIVKVLAIVSFVVFWSLLVFLNAQSSPAKRNGINLPLLALGLAYGPLSYFSSGLESPLILITAVVFAIYFCTPNKWAESFLAIAPLVRPELALALVIAFCWRWVCSRQFPKGFLIKIIVPNALWLVFRIYYYADLFPNTFYLKDISWFSQGFIYLYDGIAPYGAMWVLPLSLIVWFLAGSVRKDPLFVARCGMIITALAITAYVVKVGGDARHFRYLAFSYCLIFCSLTGLPSLAFQKEGKRFSIARVPILVLLVLCPVYSAAGYPAQLSRHPIFFPDLKAQMVNKITDGACYHRTWHDIRTFEQWRSDLEPEDLATLDRSALSYDPDVPPILVGASVYYRKIFARAVQAPGFADKFLAYIAVPSARPGHKPKIRPYMKDLIRLESDGVPVERGMFRKAIELGVASQWMQRNLETLEILERKTFNEHNFFENLVLALQIPPPIQPAEGDMKRLDAQVDPG